MICVFSLDAGRCAGVMRCQIKRRSLARMIVRLSVVIGPWSNFDSPPGVVIQERRVLSHDSARRPVMWSITCGPFYSLSANCAGNVLQNLSSVKLFVFRR